MDVLVIGKNARQYDDRFVKKSESNEIIRTFRIVATDTD
jgi:hypothetical protein